MAPGKSYAERCAELKQWLLDHHGILPKRGSSDNVEASLANWLSMTEARRTRAQGTQKQLTLQQLEELDDAMSAAVSGKRDDLLAAQLKTAREELAAKEARLAAKDAQLAAKDAQLAAKDAQLKTAHEEFAAEGVQLKRKIAELKPNTC